MVKVHHNLMLSSQQLIKLLQEKKFPGHLIPFWRGGFTTLPHNQRAKKAVSDSPGLVDFAIRLVNSVLNLPEGQVGNSSYRRTVINAANQNFFLAS